MLHHCLAFSIKREDCGWILRFRMEGTGDGVRGRSLVPIARDLAAETLKEKFCESVFPTSVGLFLGDASPAHRMLLGDGQLLPVFP